MKLNPLDYTIKELNKLTPKKGRLLIAEPFMKDPYFKRSVVLLTDYQANDVVGFILNQALDIGVNDVLVDFPPFNAPIFMGGPVEPNALFYIHNQGEIIENSRHIHGNIYWSGNFDQLKQLITEKQIFPNELIFFLGYSGWESDQLKSEIEDESWLVSDIKSDIFKDIHTKNLWKTSLQKMGNKHATLASFPEDPSLN